MASLVPQMVKNLPAMRETWVRPLGWEDPLEEGTATHSNILAWRIPQTEETGRQQFMGLQSRTHLRDSHTHMHLYMCVYVCVCILNTILSLLHTLVVVVLQWT